MHGIAFGGKRLDLIIWLWATVLLSYKRLSSLRGQGHVLGAHHSATEGPDWLLFDTWVKEYYVKLFCLCVCKCEYYMLIMQKTESGQIYMIYFVIL